MSLRSLVWQLPRRVMRSFSDRRISLWVALVLLLLALLATLVWLAGR